MSASDWPVEVDPVFGCWHWTGRLDKRDGKPILWKGSGPVAAYLVVYRAEVGEIPKGMELDHQCRANYCVRPNHLEQVTRSENERRKSWRYRAKRKTCANGHDLHLNSVVTPNGGRLCRVCQL